jgi:hypothetical protein
MLPKVGRVRFEQNPERLKVVLPVQRNWLLFALFTVCLLVWAVMLVGVLVMMIRERYELVLTIMLLVWLVIWLRLGQVLWGRWQYYTADREILFVNKEDLIVRRPVSILGATDTYDMKYVSPLYYNEKHRCPAFDYAHQHVYFGHGLTPDEANKLIETLNARYFPDGDV